MAYYYGTYFADSYYGTFEDDIAWGYEDNDTLYGGTGSDQLNGENGNDILNGESGYDTLDGGAGDDTLFANFSYAQPDIYLDDSTELDTLMGGTGNDVLYGGYGDQMDGGDGLDTFSVTLAAADLAVYVDFSALAQGGWVYYGGANYHDLEAYADIRGSAYGDQIAVGNLAQAGFSITGNPVGVHGAGGDDTLTAGNGANRLMGDDGQDSLTGDYGNDTLIGGAGDDYADGGYDDDTLTGEAGNDTLDGRDGLDTLDGGADQDLLDGGAGADSLSGGDQADTLFGGVGYNGTGLDSIYLDNTPEADTLAGGAGDDVLFAGYGDSVDGGDGTDLVSVTFAPGSGVVADFASVFAGGTATIAGGSYAGLEGYGAIFGSAYADTIDVRGGTEAPDGYVTASPGQQGVHGRAGDDSLIGGAGGTTLYGDEGNDTLDGGGTTGDDETDMLDGGLGIDTASFANAEDAVTVSVAGGYQSTGGGGIAYLTSIENLIGSAYDDLLYGLGSGNALAGGVGNDTLITGLAAGPMGYRDYYLDNGTVADTLDGGANDDILLAGYGDSVDGGDGFDVLSVTFERAQFGIFASFDQLFAGGSLFVAGGLYQHIEAYATIYGSSFADYINVAGGRYVDDLITEGGVRAGDGNDTLTGGARGDRLFGEAGDDLFLVGTASTQTDLLDGGAGIDTLSYAGALAGVTVSLAVAAAQQTGGGGIDQIAGFENLTGTNFADTLTGDGGDNLLIGGAGNDSLVGGAGQDTASYATATAGVTVNLSVTTGQSTIGAGVDTLKQIEHLTGSNYADTLIGSAGNNLLTGGAGDDVLDGGAANDTLSGGAGSDMASYASATAGVKVSLAITGAQATSGAGTDTLISIEKLFGSFFADTLTAAAAGSALNGGSGDDTLISGAGNDRIDGGDGDDIVSYANATAGIVIDPGQAVGQYTGGGGVDTLSGVEGVIGSAFDDIIYATTGDNVLDGGAGRDQLVYERATAGVVVSLALGTQATGGSGTDSIARFEDLIGSNFDDTLAGNSSDNLIGGGAGIDTLTYANAGGGITISLATEDPQNTGGAGTDRIGQFENLVGSSFADNLTGSSGANTIEGGAGNDTLNGGAGIDRLSYASATAGVVVSLALTTAQNTSGAGTDTVTGFENLTGSSRSDRLTGSAAANAIDGGDGNDTLTGGDGNDTLTGGLGNDALAGGNGEDLANYAGATAGVTVKLAVTAAQDTGGAGTDTLSGIEDVTGSAFADTLQGTNADNQLIGGDGDDNLLGGLGNDYMVGGAGSDTVSYITATTGIYVDLALTVAQETTPSEFDRILQVENIRGSAYSDTLYGNAAVNNLNGAEGNDTAYGLDGNDTLVGGAGYDTLYGGNSQDSIQGGDDNDLVYGDAGLDNLKGDAGNDTIHGGTENDTIDGGSGNDMIYGEGGRDVLTGGAGADRFFFTALADSPVAAGSRDQIRDFAHAQGDRIDLTAIDAVAGGADNAFTFIGTAAFSGVAGQLNATLVGTNWIVQGDVNGDRVADFAIQVTSSAAIVASDFLL